MRGLPLRRLAVAAAVLAAALAAAAPLGAAGSNAYTVKVLVSDVPTPGALTDPDLVNAWGLVAGPATPWWVSDNETDKSTLYTGLGAKVPLTVNVDGGPTGVVFNGSTTAFVVSAQHASGSARFIFASEDGKIRGWNPGVPPQPPGTLSTRTEVAVDNSSADAIYKGLAIAQTTHGPRLYAADFHNARIDVFDGTWAPVNAPGAFVDRSLPAHFAPFNVQTIGDRIFVAYAKQDADAEDEVAGEGLGYVDMYDVFGNLLGRVASRGTLNAPWGLAWAPDTFGAFGGDLLVGNFGDGRINAYAPTGNGHFAFQGQLRDTHGNPITIDGLWALQFGNGAAAGPKDTLFFTAGPEDETHGLFGQITAG
jgi:uncharacterized protein (TIGR03118 family)